MGEMVMKLRDERGLTKVKDERGFTLAELLIVVAIILVLVAIAVPIFMGALNNANETVEAANERSIKSQAASEYLLAVGNGTINDTAKSGWSGSEAAGYTKSYWVTANGDVYTKDPGNDDDKEYTAKVTKTAGTGNDDYIVEVTPVDPTP